MKTAIGTSLVMNALLAWALYSDHEANKANAASANQLNSATPPSNTPQQNYENASSGPPQQPPTGQPTNPPNGPNSRREYHPLGRRSLVDIPRELHPSHI